MMCENRIICAERQQKQSAPTNQRWRKQTWIKQAMKEAKKKKSHTEKNHTISKSTLRPKIRMR